MAELYKDIIAYITRNIQNQTWKEGDLIPTEMELCKQFSVSRSTVRAAMQKLQAQGLLLRIKGKGTLVTQPKILEDSTLFIESFSEELKAKGYTTKSEVLEFRHIRCDATVAKGLSLNEGDSVIKLKRLRYIDGSFSSGSIVLTTSYFPEHVRFIDGCDFERSSVHEILATHGIYRELTEKTLTAVNLDDKESRLLGVESQSIAISITSVTDDQNGERLEYCVSLYPVGRNTFTLRLRLHA